MSEKLLHEEFRKSKKSCSKVVITFAQLNSLGIQRSVLQELVKSGKTDEYGNLLAKVVEVGEISELTELKPPNINSVQQVKDFLISKGWKPQTFKYVRDDVAFQAWIDSKPTEGSKRGEWTKWKKEKPEDRAVSQITVDGGDGKELCPSILELAEEVPEVKALENYSMIKHRLGTVQGFLKNLKDYATISLISNKFAVDEINKGFIFQWFTVVNITRGNHKIQQFSFFITY